MYEPRVKDAYEVVQGFLAEEQAVGHLGEYRVTKTHNLCWREVLKEVEALWEDGDRLILIGHSYGAHAVIDIATALGASGIPIELSIAMDSVQKPKRLNSRIVPDNIERHANFYQRQGHALRGTAKHHRSDGSVKGITNQLYEVGHFPPHMTLPLALAEAGQLQRLIHGTLTQ